ncbi:MAG: helix-turn-helix transcriptional regulator, partial [Propionibacteriaceae bacterium]|nr:helix-turn-helix transcriptional regulator [Propionibacteriaceae bacterium]
YEANGLRSDAIRHALAAGDVDRAAGLVEVAALLMLGSSQEDMLYSWLTAIPNETVRARPVLSVYYAFAAFGREGFDAAEFRLQDAKRWLDPPPDAGAGSEMVVVDEAAFRSLPGTIAIARAYHAGATGNVDGIVTYARRALDLLPEGDNLWRAAAAALLGIGSWTIGELEAAHRNFADGRARLERSGYTQFQISSVHILAEIRVA